LSGAQFGAPFKRKEKMLVKFLKNHKFYLSDDQTTLHRISEGSIVEVPCLDAEKFIKKGVCSPASKNVENKMNEKAVEEKKEAPKKTSRRGRKPRVKK